MQGTTQLIKDFIAFAAKLQGDEKGESQIFLDRLFKAFGHAGVLEIGGQLEYRVRWNNTTKFADLVWPQRVLIEMKKRGERLQKHYLQARDCWMNLTMDRARYVITNFAFWTQRTAAAASFSSPIRSCVGSIATHPIGSAPRPRQDRSGHRESDQAASNDIANGNDSRQ